jgi:hypothetical protein
MATTPATGRLRWPSAMQFNSRIAEGAKDPDRRLLADLVQPTSATGRAAQDGIAGACCSCPFIVVAAPWGSAQPSALSYTKVSFVLSKGWGKPTSFVVANFTRAQLRHLLADDRHMGRGKSVILADTCLAAQFTGS